MSSRNLRSFLQPSLNYDILRAVKQEPPAALHLWEGQCAGAEVCPPRGVQAGAEVCIKQLTTVRGITERLRELGPCEEQRSNLLACEF